MDLNDDEIKDLIISEISGIIEPEEKLLLDKLRSEDPIVQQEYDRLQNKLNSPEICAFRKTLSETVPVELYERIAAIKRRRRYTKIGVGAGFIVVLAGLWLWKLWKMDESGHKMMNLHFKNAVELVTDDGAVITLDSVDRAFNAGGYKLKSNQQTLTYSVDDVSKHRGKASINVPFGKFYSIVLSDGSTVMLNSTSKMTFPFIFYGRTREIWIAGEAYIKVKRHANNPFIIHLVHSTVEVLGTELNVSTYDENETISLINGKVKVVGDRDSVLLAPGKEATVSLKNQIEVRNFDAVLKLGWLNGILSFKDKPFEDLIPVIERWYGMRLVLDSSVRGNSFIGTIDRNQPVVAFLDDLKFVGIQYHIVGDSIYIKR